MIYETGVLPSSQLYDIQYGLLSRKVGLNIVRAGTFQCDRNYSVSRGNYGSYLLMYTNNGKGFVSSSECSYSVYTGDFALIDCYHPHSYRAESNWDFDWIHLAGNLADKFFTAISALNKRHVFHVGKSYNLHLTMERLIQQIISKRGFFNVEEEAQIIRLLMDVLSSLLVISTQKVEEKPGEKAISHCLEYIHRNLDQNISVNDLAASVNYSVYYFIRLFSREVGMTPYEYIKSIRMEMARFYLRTSEVTIGEIAQKCGYTTIGNFSAAFREEMLETPSEFRAKNRLSTIPTPR
jgi:AraC family transcriptional regulator